MFLQTSILQTIVNKSFFSMNCLARKNFTIQKNIRQKIPDFWVKNIKKTKNKNENKKIKTFFLQEVN